MKEPLLILALSFITLSSGWAQDEQNSNAEVEHQIGVNASTFLQQFVIGGTADLNLQPYVLTYKCLGAQSRGFRAGLGFSNTRSSEPTQNTKTTITSADARVGYEIQKKLDDRFTFYYGVDGVCSLFMNQTRVDDNFDAVRVTTTEMGFGGALIGGIHFNISDRLALNTEFGVQGMYSEETFKVVDENFPEFNDEEKSVGHSIDMIIPTTLYFIITF